MNDEDSGQTNKRVKMIKQSNGGNAVAKRPIARPSLEPDDRYGSDVTAFCAAEIQRFISLSVAKEFRLKLRREQARVERRIDRLLDNPREDEDE